MKKILAALLLTLPTMVVAIDLDGYYITPKVGVSKSMDTGVATLLNFSSEPATLKDEDLGYTCQIRITKNARSLLIT